jgi:hypothetical protein
MLAASEPYNVMSAAMSGMIDGRALNRIVDDCFRLSLTVSVPSGGIDVHAIKKTPPLLYYNILYIIYIIAKTMPSQVFFLKKGQENCAWSVKKE